MGYSSATDIGKHRENNEDYLLNSPQYGLWLVADGMGGHAAGEIASSIAAQAILWNIKRGSSLSPAIQAGHRAILKAVEQGVGDKGMGSTIVALLTNEDSYEIAWVGDSRAYRWSRNGEGGQLEQLTKDHSYVQMLYDSGAIKAEDIKQHPEKNVITQCLGSAELREVTIDLVSNSWHENEWILLCSDGLTDAMEDKEIAQILKLSSSVSQATAALLQAALDNGARDNVTLQIISKPSRLLRYWQSAQRILVQAIYLAKRKLNVNR